MIRSTRRSSTILTRLERDINQQENVVGSASIVDLLKSANGGILPQSKGEIDRIVALIPAETKATAVPSNVLTLVQITLSEGLSEDAKTTTLKNVESLIANDSPPPGVKISVSGSTAFAEQMKTEMGSSIGVLIGAAMVLMVIVMGILFAYASHRFLPVLFVGIGLTTAMGFMGLAGIKLNMAVMGAFPVMIGLGIDYGIQFHARLDEEVPERIARQSRAGDDNPYRPCRHVRNACHLHGIYRDVYLDGPHDPLIRACGDDRCHELLMSFHLSVSRRLHISSTTRPNHKKLNSAMRSAKGHAITFLHKLNGNSGNSAQKKSSWSYGQFLTDISVKIAKNPIPILLIAGMIALIGFQIDPQIPIETSENCICSQRYAGKSPDG